MDPGIRILHALYAGQCCRMCSGIWAGLPAMSGTSKHCMLGRVWGCVQGFGVHMGIDLRVRFLPIGHLKIHSRSNRSAHSVEDLIATWDLLGESIPSCRPFSQHEQPSNNSSSSSSSIRRRRRRRRRKEGEEEKEIITVSQIRICFVTIWNYFCRLKSPRF